MTSNRLAGSWKCRGGQNNNNGSYNRNNGGSYQRSNNNANQNLVAKPTTSASTVQRGGPKNSGKLVMMGKQAVEEDSQVVTGTFLVNHKPTFVLFYSGATHSFLSRGHALTMGLWEFELDGFDVIVGMDWLGKYDAKINCCQKKVSLKGPKGIRVSYRVFVVKPKVKMIAAITLKSYLRKGCHIVLFHVRDTSMEEPSAAEIPVVGEFKDVFPEEILGLPPIRGIDFSLEHKPGTRSISKAPYCQGPKELKDFKKQ
ncbi:uncharacterized protein LOC141627717 [Silene latifolia]|uniref:uncharacterized protein LOC141627717 n=1 Tax=Silene latifolia TaxID=37657 RepID=UPI003D76B707